MSKVLITFVIIGVVAAITVPNIIAKVYEFAKQYILPYFKVEGSKLHVYLNDGTSFFYYFKQL